MTAVSDLLSANLHDVFGNRDAEGRRAAIKRIYSGVITSLRTFFAEPR